MIQEEKVSGGGGGEWFGFLEHVNFQQCQHQQSTSTSRITKQSRTNSEHKCLQIRPQTDRHTRTHICTYVHTSRANNLISSRGQQRERRMGGGVVLYIQIEERRT